jgi:NAD(P)H-quinone oxidoreductase subunit 4L
MTLETVLLVAAALIGIGVWGALAQQTFVMIMMGIELIVNGAILAGGAFWAYTGGGAPKGQVLVIIAMAVMAVEMAIGFALVVAVYRARQADMTEGISSLKG